MYLAQRGGIVHHVLENLVDDDHVAEVIIERYAVRIRGDFAQDALLDERILSHIAGVAQPESATVRVESAFAEGLHQVARPAAEVECMRALAERHALAAKNVDEDSGPYCGPLRPVHAHPRCARSTLTTQRTR